LQRGAKVVVVAAPPYQYTEFYATRCEQLLYAGALRANLREHRYCAPEQRMDAHWRAIGPYYPLGASGSELTASAPIVRSSAIAILSLYDITTQVRAADDES
jgi:hypothetical protein